MAVIRNGVSYKKDTVTPLRIVVSSAFWSLHCHFQ